MEAAANDPALDIDILSVLEDNNLLGQFIEDPATWASWFCFLRSFFALPPAKGDASLYRSCTGRSEWPQEPSRAAWAASGVRGGKSKIVALLAAYLAAFRTYQLSPGENGYILIVAPTKRQSSIVKRYLSSFFSDNPFLAPFLVRETSVEIELSNHVIIAVLSSDYRSLRGFTAIAAIVDEIAYLNLEGSKPDIEIVRALRSRLMTTGGPLICISSPYSRQGMLYQTYQKHHGADGSPILTWQADSLTMNPTLSKELIQNAYEEDPEASAADYGAMFRSDIESYVSRAALEACTIPERFELPPVADVRYKSFVDPSGGAKDSFCLAISHAENGDYVLDCIRERKPPFNPDQVCRDFAATMRDYGVFKTVGDRYGGLWPSSRFKAHGVRYEPAAMPKSDLYRELLPLINSGRVELLDHQKLIHQLASLERRVSRSGKDNIDHPRGYNAHDDLANCCAGSIVEAVGKSDKIFKTVRCEDVSN
jgi:hypothetical protein